jgi:hypothetical protein
VIRDAICVESTQGLLAQVAGRQHDVSDGYSLSERILNIA